jgi:hypothetical protein
MKLSSAKKRPVEQAASEYRVNARIDAVLAQKLEYLTEKHALSVSEVIKASIDHLYRATYASAKQPYEAMLETGFIASGDGPEDLSSEYKKYLSHSWREKHSVVSVGKRRKSASRSSA